MKRFEWTEEIEQFLIDNYEGKDCIELAELINKRFNTNITNKNVSNKKANIKRRKGIDLYTNINRGKYRLGVPPANKGKKWDEYMSKEAQEKSRKNLFKKGNTPPNRREIGEERISVDDYVEIKIQDGKGGKNWVGKHRYMYEKYHGKIPEKHKIIFADGNRRNFSKENLIAVSKSEELIMNRNKLIFDEKELTKTGVLIAKVIDKVNKKKKEGK